MVDECTCSGRGPAHHDDITCTDPLCRCVWHGLSDEKFCQVHHGWLLGNPCEVVSTMDPLNPLAIAFLTPPDVR